LSTVSIGTIAAYWKAVSDWVTGATTSKPIIQGAVADSAAKAGNPLQIGGIYSTTPATRHDGDVVAWEMTSTGSGLVQLSGSIPTGANTIGYILLAGNIKQEPDIISTDTTITAGATITYGVGGSGGASWAAKLSKLGIALRLSASKKFKVFVQGYSLSDDTLTDVAWTNTLIDASVTALTMSGAICNLITSKYRIMVFNADSTDMIIKSLTRTEVA